MDQPVPRVDRNDVERVVRRDFSPRDQPAALQVLADYWGHGAPHRVHLAALKLSSGSIAKLRDWIAEANLDYRDVLVAAEYPLAEKRSSSLNGVPEAERDEVYAADWRQYQLWLRRP